MDFDSEVESDGIRRVADWLARALEDVSGSARVADAAVSGGVGQVQVSAQGRLVGLQLTPDAMQLRSDRLAAWIEQAYVAACESAVSQIRQKIGQVTDANPELKEFFDDLDRDFGKLSTSLRAPEPRAERGRHQPDRRSEWTDPDEWDPSSDPFGRTR